MDERANEQTRIIERDIASLSLDHKKLNERFDRHLEIYAQNGKELVALRTQMVESHKGFDSKLEAIYETARENKSYIFGVEERNNAAIDAVRKEMKSIEIEMSRATTKIAVAAVVVPPMMGAVAGFLVNRLLL